MTTQFTAAVISFVGIAVVAAIFLFSFVSISLATAQTTVRRSTGTHDFGESKASTRNQGPKSSSYYTRGQTESKRRREMYEEMWDDYTSPRVHQSGGYCMYGLDGQLIDKGSLWSGHAAAHIGSPGRCPGLALLVCPDIGGSIAMA